MQTKHWQIAYLTVLCAAIVVLYASFAVLIEQGKFFARPDASGKAMLTDFCVFYTSGVLVKDAHAQHLDIYDAPTQFSYMLRNFGNVKPDKPFFLDSPPYLFAFFTPVSFFPPAIAWAVHCLIGAGLASVAFWFLAKRSIGSLLGRVLAMACFFASYPTWLAFGMGQTTMFLFASFVLFFESLRRARYATAAFSTLLLCLKLQYMPMITVIGLVLGRLRFFVCMAAVGCILLAISLLCVEWQSIVGYPQALYMAETTSKVDGASGITMQNMRGWLGLMTGGDGKIVHVIAAATMFIAVGGVGYLWWTQRTITGHSGPSLTSACTQHPVEDDEDEHRQLLFDSLVSISLPLMIFSSLHSHIYDTAYMAIPCLLLWRHQDRMTSGMRNFFRVVCLGFPAFSWVFATAKPMFTSAFIQPFSLWDLCVLAVAVQVYRSGRKNDG